MNRKKIKDPGAFGAPHYPSFQHYIAFGTVQVFPIRPNASIYLTDFRKFKKWLDQVEKYAKQELSK